MITKTMYLKFIFSKKTIQSFLFELIISLKDNNYVIPVIDGSLLFNLQPITIEICVELATKYLYVTWFTFGLKNNLFN